MLGATAWVVALLVGCLVTDSHDLLLPVVLPLGLASLGLGMLLLVSLEGAAPAAAGSGNRGVPGTVCAGAVSIVIGLLLLLVHLMLIPAFQTHDRLAAFVRDLGGIIELPDWIGTAVLGAGCVVLAFGMRRVAAKASNGN